MTEEEMNKKIQEAEAKAEAAQKEIEDLKNQRSDQNSYITKLEGKVKGLETSMESVKTTVNQGPSLAPEITEYFQKKRREDYTDQAVAEIISQVGEDEYNCMKDELNNFLKLYMTEKNVSVRYIIDAFHLLLGRALANPDHEIHNVLTKASTTKTDPVVPEPVSNQDQDKFREELNRMVNRTMTNEDTNIGGAPEVKAPTVQNTQEAMKAFKTKLFNLDSSRFE